MIIFVEMIRFELVVKIGFRAIAIPIVVALFFLKCNREASRILPNTPRE